jgi:hypothetical protein
MLLSNIALSLFRKTAFITETDQQWIDFLHKANQHNWDNINSHLSLSWINITCFILFFSYVWGPYVVVAIKKSTFRVTSLFHFSVKFWYYYSIETWIHSLSVQYKTFFQSCFPKQFTIFPTHTHYRYNSTNMK